MGCFLCGWALVTMDIMYSQLLSTVWFTIIRYEAGWVPYTVFQERNDPIWWNEIFSNCLTSIWEAQVWILSKPYFFLASLLQLLKLQSICKDHFFASFSSVGQMKLISLQVVKNFILHQNHAAVYNFYKWSLCKTHVATQYECTFWSCLLLIALMFDNE